MKTTTITIRLVLTVVALCVLPTLLNLLGVDFSSHGREFDPSHVLRMANGQVVDAMHVSVQGLREQAKN